MIGRQCKKAGRRREVPRTVSSIFYADKNGPRGISVAQKPACRGPDGGRRRVDLSNFRSLSVAHPVVETNFSPQIRDVTGTRTCNVNC